MQFSNVLFYIIYMFLIRKIPHIPNNQNIVFPYEDPHRIEKNGKSFHALIYVTTFYFLKLGLLACKCNYSLLVFRELPDVKLERKVSASKGHGNISKTDGSMLDVEQRKEV